MEELCGILGVLLVVGLIVMLVGHVMWLGVAAIVRGLTGTRKAGPAEEACPRCGLMRLEGQPCRMCGHSAPMVVQLAGEDEAQVALRQVRQLRERELIDEATCQSVELALKRAKMRAFVHAPAPEGVMGVMEGEKAEAGYWEQPAEDAAPTPLPVVAVEEQVVDIAPPCELGDEGRGMPRPYGEPRRPFSQVLGSFMEQKNIRWGELVGGLLIIGCSIALVLTFWSEISQRPALKFSLFTSITAAVFGVGLYTQHRWRLPTTSRGALLFACVLVPLNFLAVVLQAAAPSGVVTMGGELLSFALFGWLVHLAGRVLAPAGAGALALGVVGASACQALVNRFMPAGAEQPLSLAMGLGAMPIALCWGAMGWTIAAGRREAEKVQAATLLTALALVSFAALVPLGLLVHRMGDATEAMRRLAPLLSLAGVPALVTGLILWRRLEDRALAGLRTAGTAVAVGGALVMLAGLAAGWPNPSSMLPVALVDFAALTVAAFAFGIPAAHLLALPCLALAYVLGVQVGFGHVGWTTDTQTLVKALTDARAGVALVPLVVALLGGAALLAKRGREEDGFYHVVVAAGAAALSLALVSVHGLGRVEDGGATWVYLMYAVGAFAVALRSGRASAWWAGSAMLALAAVQGVVYHWQVGRGLADRWTGAMLAYATVLFGVQALARRVGLAPPTRWDKPHPTGGDTGRMPVPRGLVIPALAATAVAAVLVAQSALVGPAWGVLAWKTLWLAGLWLVAAVAMSSHALFALFQCALAAGVGFGVVAVSGTPLKGPRMLQLQGIAMAGLGLGWIGIRAGMGRFSALLRTAWSVDRVVTLALAAGVLVLGIWGAAEPVTRELARRMSDIAATDLDAAARGPLAWVSLGLTLAALLLQQRERFSFERLSAVFVLLGGGALLLAGRFEPANSAASAWRWLCAIILAGGSGIVWVLPPRPGQRLARTILLAFSIAPVLAVTSYSAAVALNGGDVAGPVAGTLFGRMGNSVNYLGPLVVLMLVLIGYAARERSAGFAFSGAMVLNYAVSLGYPLWLIGRDIAMGPGQIVTLIQLNALAAGVFALAWCAAQYRFGRCVALSADTPHLNPLPTRGTVAGEATSFERAGRGSEAPFSLSSPAQRMSLCDDASSGRGEGRGEGPSSAARTQPSLLVLLAGLAVAVIAILQARGVGQVIFRTASIEPWALQTGNLLGWIAWLAAGGAAVAVTIRQYRRIPTGLIFAGILALVSLVGTRAAGIEGWLGLHALIAGTAMGSWAILAIGGVGRAMRDEDDSRTPASRAVALWACTLGGMVLLLSLYAYTTADPHQPWWSIGGLVAVSVLCVGLSLWTLSSAWLYPAGILLNICAGLWWNHQTLVGGPIFWSYPQTHVIILASCGIAFLMLELFFLRPMRQQAVRMGIPAYHHPAAILCGLVMAGLTAILLLAHLGGSGVRPGPLLMWGSIAAVAALFGATLWDERARYAVGGLYLMGLAAALTALDAFGLTAERMIWIGAIVVAAYALVAGFMFTQRTAMTEAARNAGIPARAGWMAPSCTWLSGATLVQSLAVICAAGWAVDTLGQLPERLAAACAVIGMAVAIGMLAGPRGRMREIALLVGAIGAVLWSWAWLEPTQWRLLLLNRMVVTMAALAGMTAFYAIGMVKVVRRENEWTAAARRLVPLLGGATGAALIAVLGAEASLYDATLVAATHRGVPMAWWAIGTVAGALVLLSVTGIICAAVPGKDPLDLPDRTRTLYVYGAEFMLVLLFVHIKICVPDLLNLGIWNRYWPAILMGLAFAGVGLSELFRRQNRLVLAEPLENSAAFLPILPIATYWLMDGTWSHARYIPYASVLLVAGIVYGTLAFLRRSFFFGLLAALAGNGALWWMLHHTERFGFLQHPQLWLIPAALSVLAAAQLNRDRLGEQQVKNLRYLCLMVIYASSTADIWINGVEKSPGLAMILAALSVVGVLAGIAWRIQSFLFLGTTFLMVSLMTMVYYAALRLHHNWPWYAAGIVLGIGIVAVFALFEKKREDMLRLMEGLRQWEG